MNHATRARAALFTSLGLLPALPLACADDSLQPCGVSTPVPANTAAIAGAVPQPRGVSSGLQLCQNGVLHRPEPVSCESQLPRALPPASTEPGLSQLQFLYPGIHPDVAACASDAECTDKPFGYCAPTFADEVGTVVDCIYGCVVDDDCGAGFLCQCGEPVGRCIPAGCRSDQDCGDQLCAAWFTEDVCSSQQAFACQTPDDECNTSADCADRGTCIAEGGRRHCEPPSGQVCGRPFLVQDTPRMAGLVFGGGWSTPGARPCEQSPDLQRRVAEHFARAALMEHASIAAFARFTLQLLHLGAPRELIEESQRAMLDESEHARLCFGLAERHLGVAVGPGPLPMHDALLDLAFERIVSLCFREGCVGETVAALEAQIARDHATDPDVCSALGRIGPDELRHAELAWKFVRWALREKPAATRALLAIEAEQLRAELAAAAPSSPVAGEPGLLEHGVLPEGERARVRRLALREVVLPCADALLALTATDPERGVVVRA